MLNQARATLIPRLGQRVSSLKTPTHAEPDERNRVIDFRRDWLRASGYNKHNADLIASDLELDWHFACDLRTKCTDEVLCMRILYGS